MRGLLTGLILLLTLTACTPRPALTPAPPFIPPAGQPTVVTAPTSAPSPAVSEMSLPLISQAPAPFTYWIDPALPQGLRQGWQPPADLLLAGTAAEADIRVEVNPAGSSQWFYALAAPFPTLLDGLPLEEIMRLWRGEESPLAANAPLYLSEETRAAFSALWGLPQDRFVTVFNNDAQVLDAAWEARTVLALIPFESLAPRWKVLRVDGLSPYDRDMSTVVYPLSVWAGIVLSDAARAALDAGRLTLPVLPATNRDVEKMSVVLLTGTTALVRATAFAMDQRGVDFPAGTVLPWLENADILHISNESSFYANCPAPDPYDPSLQFCSDPAHFALFKTLGVDVVELSGNHLGDYGRQPFVDTMNLLAASGIPYYAAGMDNVSAGQPLLLEDHGNRLAFLGCNNAGPDYVWAGADQPGAARCDFEWLSEEVFYLRSQGYQVIFTFQYQESLGPLPTDREKADFRSMAAAGASVVSGSQAHMPMIMEFYDDSFIHYGPGNFIFDQMFALENRQEFIERHVFYNGAYIGTELLTALLEDYARPRPMNETERLEFLSRIFSESGW